MARKAVAVQIIGHRGVVDLQGPAENTLAAVARALDEGADGVEVDVRLTSDGIAVCVHDRDLHRVAGNCVEVSRSTLAELRRVQLPGGHLVPTVAEVLETVADRGVVVLDLKPVGARTHLLLERVAQDLCGVAADAVIVSSGDITAITAAGELLPGRARALICDVTVRLRAAARLARQCDIDLHPHLRCLLADLPTARGAVDSGQRLRPWTVNDAADLRALDDVGISAVITDDPRSAVTSLGEIMAFA